jgi:hypothetical protein
MRKLEWGVVLHGPSEMRPAADKSALQPTNEVYMSATMSPILSTTKNRNRCIASHAAHP